MSQSSLAVSVDGQGWAVLNASPDIRQQLAVTPQLAPTGLRDSPLRAVVLTNGDIDHVAGLLTLREKTRFTVFATSQTLDILDANAVFAVLDPALVEKSRIALDSPFAPLDGLEVTAFAVPGKVALYLEGDEVDTNAMGEQTVGLRLSADGHTVYYIPGCANVTDDLLARLADADLVLFDGTVWRNDEMPSTGTGAKTGARMGHVAMDGPDGSIARLAGLTCRKVFVHINNTNPALQPDGPERAALSAAGWQIAADGMEITP
jgi:pyrroloquinoline quinone biosynthesis protein B